MSRKVDCKVLATRSLPVLAGELAFREEAEEDIACLAPPDRVNVRAGMVRESRVTHVFQVPIHELPPLVSMRHWKLRLLHVRLERPCTRSFADGLVDDILDFLFELFCQFFVVHVLFNVFLD